VKRKIRRQLERGKRKILRRLMPFMGGTEPRAEGKPEFTGPRPTYEMAERVEAMPYGGIGIVHDLVREVGLPEQIDSAVDVLGRHRPYHESDHVLNIAYNIMVGGHVLDDIEHRRNDMAFLNALGARAIPDPTTAGDFCRRFDEDAIWRLMRAINGTRIDVWQRSDRDFSQETARIDADGSLVPTNGECKQGMDVSYNGIWGYHPLLISLANTKEPLFLVNRSGNRPSHEGAPAALDQAIELCQAAGFRDVLLRGDTDFSMTAHLDRWDAAGVRFVFGYDASSAFVDRAENLQESDYQELLRKADEQFRNPRTKPPRIKEEIVRERGYFNQQLLREDTAEFEHQPQRAKQPYRIVVLRKVIHEEKGQVDLGWRFRYFFFVTNDRNLSQDEVIAEAHERCDQENVIEQLKNGVRALRAPLNTLEANWAYMVMASLAWTLKAWFALLLPVSSRWRQIHEADQRRVLHMDFRTFLQSFILIPAQIVRSGRRLIYRLLAWRPELPILFRLIDAL
jgi:hypothetical protein